MYVYLTSFKYNGLKKTIKIYMYVYLMSFKYNGLKKTIKTFI